MKPDRNKYIWAIFMAIALVVTLLPIASYIAAIDQIKDEWDLNNSEVGMIYSSYLIGYALSALIIVPLTDKGNRKAILIVSAVISVTAHILFSIVSDNFITGSIVRLLAGVGYLGIYICGIRIISDQFDENNKGKVIGLFVTSQYLSHSISLGLTDALINITHNWRLGYSLVSMLSASGIILFFFLIYKTEEIPVTNTLNPWTFKLDKNIIKVIISYSIHALVLYSLRVWSPVFLNSIFAASSGEFSNKISGNTIAAIAFAIAALGPFIGGIFADRIGIIRSSSIIIAICSISGFLFGFVELINIIPLIIVLFFIYTFSASADSSIYQTGIITITKNNKLGQNLGMQSFAGLISGCIGPIIIGFVTDVSPNNYQWIISFSLLGFLSLLSFVNINMLSIPNSKFDQR